MGFAASCFVGDFPMVVASSWKGEKNFLTKLDVVIEGLWNRMTGINCRLFIADQKIPRLTSSNPDAFFYFSSLFLRLVVVTSWWMVSIYLFLSFSSNP